MLIKRDVFTKLIKEYPDRKLKTTIDGKYGQATFYNFFDTYYDPETKRYLMRIIHRLWSKIGKLYCYVMSYITHVGEFQYTGRLYDSARDGESSTKSE